MLILLYISLKEEAIQTRSDLELTNNEINELKRDLDTLGKQSEEAQFSWNILMKKSKTIQEELTEKRNILQNVQIQYKMTVLYTFLSTKI